MMQNIQIVMAALLGLALLAPTQTIAQSPNLAQENYRQADADSDGVLVQAEFARFIDLNAEDDLGRAARISARGMHAQAFRRVNGNGDGRVTPTELQAMSRR